MAGSRKKRRTQKSKLRGGLHRQMQVVERHAGLLRVTLMEDGELDPTELLVVVAGAYRAMFNQRNGQGWYLYALPREFQHEVEAHYRRFVLEASELIEPSLAARQHQERVEAAVAKLYSLWERQGVRRRGGSDD